jgi:hypothetical protein
MRITIHSEGRSKIICCSATVFREVSRYDLVQRMGSEHTFTVVFRVPHGTSGAEIIWNGSPSKIVRNGTFM